MEEHSVEQHIAQVENTVVILEIVYVLQGAAVVVQEHSVEQHIADLENTVVIQQ